MHNSGCQSRALQTTTACSGPRSLLIPAPIPRMRFVPHRSELALLVMHVGIRIRSLHHDLCAQRHRAELRRALLLTTKAFSTSRFHSSLASPLPGPLRGCAHLVSCHLKDQAGLGALAWSIIQGLNGLSCLRIGITPRHSCVWPDIVSITPPPRLRYDLSIIPQWRFSLLHT